MGNLTMPTPVALAGGALCLVGGYLIGSVSAPDPASRPSGAVESYDSDTQELCLRGDGVEGQPGARDGYLCGQWRPSIDDQTPQQGDTFRFVSIVSRDGDSDDDAATNLYGSVVG